MFRSRSKSPEEIEMAQIIAAVASETKSYNDPRADYPAAERFRQQRAEGVARRTYRQGEARVA